MPGANPLIQGGDTTPLAAEPTVGYEPPAAESGPANRGFMGAGAASMAGFSHIDNTSNHVAVLVAGAAAIIAFLYFGGFNFAVDAGVMRK